MDCPKCKNKKCEDIYAEENNICNTCENFIIYNGILTCKLINKEDE